METDRTALSVTYLTGFNFVTQTKKKAVGYSSTPKFGGLQ